MLFVNRQLHFKFLTSGKSASLKHIKLVMIVSEWTANEALIILVGQ